MTRSNREIFKVTSGGIFTLSAILFVVLILWLTSGYPPAARHVPQVVCIFSLICLVVQLALDSFPPLGNIYGKIEGKGASVLEMLGEKVQGSDSISLRLEILVFLWLGALLAGLLLFGFLISIPSYILFYLRFQAQLGWLRSALYGACTLLFVYLIFVRLLEIRLYSGFIVDKILNI